MGGSATGGRRIKREHIKQHAEMFLTCAHIRAPYYITGSFRRERPESGDIELVFLINDPQLLSETRVAIAKIFGYCLNGNPKMQGIWGEVQFDLFIADDLTLGSMLLHTTGNGLFNIHMRKQAQMFGLKLNQYGLWRGEERIVAGNDEKLFFVQLSMNYVEPKDRSI